MYAHGCRQTFRNIGSTYVPTNDFKIQLPIQSQKKKQTDEYIKEGEGGGQGLGIMRVYEL
jgi:hypothetical protein